MSQTNRTLSSQPNKLASFTSFATLRWIGYAMVVLFLLDVAVLLYPLDLMNPEWEFQTVGNMIERVVVPIMGVGFIFLGEEQGRNSWEMLMMKLLSWVSLLVGILFIIALPLVLATSAQRIAAQIDNNFGDQYQAQISQSQVLQEQIESASADDLQTLIANQAEGSNISSPEEARQELLTNLAQARQELQTQVQGEINQRKTVVKKNAVKWILGSFIAGALFAYIWHLTRWARVFPTGNILEIFSKTKKARL